MEWRRTDRSEKFASTGPSAVGVFVHKAADHSSEGALMHYALLMYSPADSATARTAPIDPDTAATLDRPEIVSWLRLYPHESATTVRSSEGRTLLTDGPFIDSKEFLGGFILVEADDLDGALAVAGELQEFHRIAAIEVRPVLEQS